MKPRKKAKKTAASFKNVRVKSEKMSDYRYGAEPSILLSTSVDHEGSADRELKHLVHADVFRSNPQTIKQTNSNKRRYA